MFKNLMEVINTSEQKMVADGLVAFNDQIVKVGSNKALEMANESTVRIRRGGLYKVTVELAVSPVGTEPVEFTLISNGEPLRGAVATITSMQGVKASIGMTYLVTVLKSCPCYIDNTINLQVKVNTDTKVDNSNIIVEQLI